MAREAVVARKEVVVVIMAAAAAAWGAQGAGSAGEDRGVMVTVVGRVEEAMVKATRQLPLRRAPKPSRPPHEA